MISAFLNRNLETKSNLARERRRLSLRVREGFSKSLQVKQFRRDRKIIGLHNQTEPESGFL